MEIGVRRCSIRNVLTELLVVGTVRMNLPTLDGSVRVDSAGPWLDHQCDVGVRVGVIEEAVVIEQRIAGRSANRATVAVDAGTKGGCGA